MPSRSERTTPGRVCVDNAHVTPQQVEQATAAGLDAAAVLELAVHQALDPDPSTTRTVPLYLPISKAQWEEQVLPAMRARGLDATGYATLGLYRYVGGQYVPPKATRSSTPRDAHKTSLRLPERLLAEAGALMAEQGMAVKPSRVAAAFLMAEFESVLVVAAGPEGPAE